MNTPSHHTAFARVRFARVLVAMLAFLFSAFVAARGQSNQGTLAGSVVDTTGAAVAGAAITARNDATGQTSGTVTSSSGDYRFPSLQVGAYTVTAAAKSFQQSSQTGVAVQIQTTTALNITLKVGSEADTVTVDSTAPQIQTESSDISTVVTAKQVEDLPLSTNGGAIRNAQAFVFLTPATYGTGTNGGTFEGGVSGGQAFGSEILYDGASLQVQSFGDGFADEILPSVDSVDEFNVLVSGVPAQYGRTSGGIQSYNTRSGTNVFHGTLYEIFRNTDLDANNWFLNRDIAVNGNNAGNQRTPDNKNEYGGSLGGPVRIPYVYNGRDKTFFFFTWEQFKQKPGYANFITLPTLAQLGGDFRSTLTTTVLATNNPCTGQPIYQGEIFDPATTRTVGGVQCRSPFTFNGNLNTIDPARFSKVAQGIAGYLPKTRNNTSLTNNYLESGTTPIVDTTYTLRLDHAFNQNNKVFGSYSLRENVKQNLVGGQLALPITNTQTFQDLPTHIVRIGYDHVFSPTVLNHFLVGITRVLNTEGYQNSLGSTNYSQALNLPGGSGSFFPGISLGESNDYALGDIQGNAGFNSHISDNSGYLGDSVSISRGKHNLQVGAEYRYLLSVSGYTSQLAGSFYFGRAQTAGDNASSPITSNSGNGVASFLLGQPNYSRTDRALVSVRNLGQYTGIYVQDQYKVSHDLNLSLGLRYNVELPMREEHDFSSQFSPTAANPGAPGRPGALVFAGNGPNRDGLSSRYANIYYKAIEPRIGLAYAPSYFNNKTVIQANYGILNASLLEWQQIYNGISTGYAPTAQRNSNASGNFQAAENLDTDGTPVPGNTISYDPTQLNGNNIPYNRRDFGRPGNNMTWSASLQQEFLPDLIMTLSYLGQRGTHLPSNLLQLNNISPSQFARGQALGQPLAAGAALPYAGFTGTLAQSLRPFPQYSYINTAAYGEDHGQQSFNAMTAKLERKFHNGVNLLASYTWSKNITDTGNIIGGSLGGAYTANIQNPFNLRAEKAISPQDLPNLFVVSYLFELPVGHGRHFLNNTNGFVNALIGGWAIGGIQRYQEGQPIGFGCASGIPGFDNCIRFNLTGANLHSAKRDNGHFNPTTDSWYNPAAFADPNDSTRLGAGGAYAFGNKPAYQSNDRSFNYYSEDFSFIKRTAITEQLKFQFRVEMFNAFNRVVFGNPDTNFFNGQYTGQNVIGSGDFGNVGYQANTPRQVQLTGRFEF